jgi:hypothetical protein
MSKFKKFTKPTRVSDLDFESLYDEISSDIDQKISRLIKRRERKLRAGFDGI